MNKQNKPSYLTGPNVTLGLMLLFILYQIGLRCFIADTLARARVEQQRLVQSQEIADIIKGSLDQAVSYINLTFDFNEYVKPSIHYIYDAYTLVSKGKNLTPSQDSAVIYYYHFKNGFFFGHKNLNYDATHWYFPKNPILSRILRKGDCDEMALFSYTYACLKGIPCCMFVIEGGLWWKPWHARFAMEKHIFQQTDVYQYYVHTKKRYAYDAGMQAKCDNFLNPLEAVVDGKTYCFFDEAFDFTHDISEYTAILSERWLDWFEDVQIIDNADILQYLRDENMANFFQKEFQ